MVAFIVSGEPGNLERDREFYENLEGLAKIKEITEETFVLYFEDREHAIAAQWMMDLNGAHKMDEGE